MKGTYDVQGVQEQGKAELLPVAGYVFAIKSVKDATVKDTQIPMAKLVLTVVGGPDGTIGKTAFHNVTFSPKGNPGAGITKRFLKVIGERFNEQTEQYDYDTARWPGRMFAALVTHETYKGAPSNKIGPTVDFPPDGFKPQYPDGEPAVAGAGEDKELGW